MTFSPGFVEIYITVGGLPNVDYVLKTHDGAVWDFYKRFFPGGANQFADAFAVAERMRKEFPEEFDLLSTVKV